ncbi:MAG: HAD family hydrolase [Sandaracinaceae bacterium]
MPACHTGRVSRAAHASELPVVLFDFDGTIADSFELVLAQYNAIAPRFRARAVDHAELPRLRKLAVPEIMREHRVTYWKLPLLVWSMRRRLHAHVADVAPFPGIVEALHALRDAGVRSSVLSTNSSANIERFLSRHDLRVFDDVAGGVSMFGKARALRRWVARAGVPKERVVYVGDEERDIDAAKAAGIRSVAVSWGYADRAQLAARRPTHLVDHPRELVTLILSG